MAFPQTRLESVSARQGLWTAVAGRNTLFICKTSALVTFMRGILVWSLISRGDHGGLLDVKAPRGEPLHPRVAALKVHRHELKKRWNAQAKLL